jgi:hypothetical protein
MKNFLQGLLGRAFTLGVEASVHGMVGEVRRDLARRFGLGVRALSGTARGLVFGVLLAALGAGGLLLIPAALVAGILALCMPDQVRLGVVLSALLLAGFALLYVALPIGLLLIVTGERRLRRSLGADEIERRIAGC